MVLYIGSRPLTRLAKKRKAIVHVARHRLSRYILAEIIGITVLIITVEWPDPLLTARVLL